MGRADAIRCASEVACLGIAGMGVADDSATPNAPADAECRGSPDGQRS